MPPVQANAQEGDASRVPKQHGLLQVFFKKKIKRNQTTSGANRTFPSLFSTSPGRGAAEKWRRARCELKVAAGPAARGTTAAGAWRGRPERGAPVATGRWRGLARSTSSV